MSSVSEASTSNQEGGGKGKDKNKELLILKEESLVEINTSMSALMGKVDDMDKRIKELKSKEDPKELREEMHAAVNSVMADFNKEIQVLQATWLPRIVNSKLARSKLKLTQQRLRLLRYKSSTAWLQWPTVRLSR